MKALRCGKAIGADGDWKIPRRRVEEFQLWGEGVVFEVQNGWNGQGVSALWEVEYKKKGFQFLFYASAIQTGL